MTRLKRKKEPKQPPVAPRERGIAMLVVRSSRNKAGIRTQWLHGLSEPAEAREEAQGLVDDPRDSILRVDLWDSWRQQFVGVVRKSFVA